MKKSKLSLLLFLIAFIEGGSLLAVELICGRVLSPYFGASLYVWTTVIGITLTGLAVAYFLGGYLSSKFSSQVLLAVSLFVSSASIASLPYLFKPVIELTGNLELPHGAIVAASIFMLPFLIILGMVPMFLINMLSSISGKTGSTTGKIFGVSTFGAVCVTFLTGFYLIPIYGVFISLYLITILLILTFVAWMLMNSYFKGISLSLIPILFLLFSPHNNFDNYDKEKFILHEESDGLLGHLLVAENLEQQTKFLFINGLPQTVVDTRNSNPLNHYVNEVLKVLDPLKRENKVLILGMGGGSLAASLVRKELDVDIVELDKRLTGISETYFGLNLSKCNVYHNDARNYIKTTNKKYDIIIVDVYAGDQAPSHVLTFESFSEMKNLLLPGGAIIIYHPGNNDTDDAFDMLISTTKKAGMDNYILPIGHSKSKVKLVICTKAGALPYYTNIHKATTHPFAKINEKNSFMDDKPLLEILQLEEIKNNNFRRIFWKSFLKKREED